MEELFLKIQIGHAHVNFVRHLIFIKYLFVKKKKKNLKNDILQW